jgi:hypothetical protein
MNTDLIDALVYRAFSSGMEFQSKKPTDTDRDGVFYDDTWAHTRRTEITAAILEAIGNQGVKDPRYAIVDALVAEYGWGPVMEAAELFKGKQP